MPNQSKPPRGRRARGSKGATREKLAKAAGFRSDAEITKLFSDNRLKQVTQVQQDLADMVAALQIDDLKGSAIAFHYGALMRSLADPQAQVISSPSEEPAVNGSKTARENKQAALATEALRQMVLEAVESPLAMLPSLLADDSLSSKQKLERLTIYASALEAVYEPLELEPIGDPGDPTSFDPRHHESADGLNKGDACTIRQIGFKRGDAVVRKAVVAIAE